MSDYDKKLLDRAHACVIRARLQLIRERPFYAHLVMKLKLEWGDEDKVPLSCTDGRTLMINPKTFVTLTAREHVSVLVHEVLHCAWGHFARINGRDPERWNDANDINISNTLRQEGFESIKGNDAYLMEHGYDVRSFQGMTSEDIYAKLPQKKNKRRYGSGSGDKSCKGHKHWNGEGGCYKKPQSVSESSKLESEWRTNVHEAAQMAGNAPGAWQELVKAATPKTPFHLKLYEYLNRGLGGETTWEVLNRRQIYRGMYLPSDTKIVMGEVVIAVDTSGSMSSEQLQKAFSYIRGFREAHPCKCHIIQCDYGVAEGTGYDVYEEHAPLPQSFKVTGRGGTQFDPPFALIKERKIEPKVFIYMTDGYGDIHDNRLKPACPVLWVLVGKKSARNWKAPFGEVVSVD